MERTKYYCTACWVDGDLDTCSKCGNDTTAYCNKCDELYTRCTCPGAERVYREKTGYAGYPEND